MLTVRREIGRHVIGVGGSRVIIVMTAVAGIRRVVVIAVVASHTIICNGDVCTLECPVLTVVKCRGCPFRLSMTFLTIGRELICHVVRIGGGIEIIIMAAIAGIRGVVVIAVVAGRTVIGNVGMRPV